MSDSTRPDMLSLARLISGEAGRRPESAQKYIESGPGQALKNMAAFIEARIAEDTLRQGDPKRIANDLWSLILSGPRDYYLHHIHARPSQKELLDAIGHWLAVFLTVYSKNQQDDLAALNLKIEGYIVTNA